MSFEELNDKLLSKNSIEYVQYEHDDQLVWCSWQEFEEVAKDTVGSLKNKYDIKVVGDGWWVDYYGCNDSYYSGWRRHRLPDRPETRVKPSLKDVEKKHTW